MLNEYCHLILLKAKECLSVDHLSFRNESENCGRLGRHVDFRWEIFPLLLSAREIDARHEEIQRCVVAEDARVKRCCDIGRCWIVNHKISRKSRFDSVSLKKIILKF